MYNLVAFVAEGFILMNLKREGRVKPGGRLSNTRKSVPASQKTHCISVINNAADSINRIHYTTHFVSTYELFTRRDKAFNKQRLNIYLELQSASRYAMSDSFFSVHCQMKTHSKMPHRVGHGKNKWRWTYFNMTVCP